MRNSGGRTEQRSTLHRRRFGRRFGPAKQGARRKRSVADREGNDEWSFATHGVLLIVRAREGLDESVVRVRAGELRNCEIEEREGQFSLSRTRRERDGAYGGRRGGDVVDAVREDGDGAKHGQELGQGREGFHLVDIGSPHRLDVVVLGDLVGRESLVSRARGGEKRGREGTDGFAKVDALLRVPPPAGVPELPRVSRQFRVAEVGEGGFLVGVVQLRLDGRVRRGSRRGRRRRVRPDRLAEEGSSAQHVSTIEGDGGGERRGMRDSLSSLISLHHLTLSPSMSRSAEPAPVPAPAEVAAAPVEPPKKRMVKRRPARKQVEQGQIEKKQPEQTGQTYNHWYHKWVSLSCSLSPRSRTLRKLTPSLSTSSTGRRRQVRHVRREREVSDEGRHQEGRRLHARRRRQQQLHLSLLRKGLLSVRVRSTRPFSSSFRVALKPVIHRSECSYLHRLPPPAHVLPDASLDVFGREKHSGYRDDMGGVGSFNRQNRTLYIGRIRETRDTAEAVEDHFSEFGEIERSQSFPSLSLSLSALRTLTSSPTYS